MLIDSRDTQNASEIKLFGDASTLRRRHHTKQGAGYEKRANGSPPIKKCGVSPIGLASWETTRPFLDF